MKRVKIQEDPVAGGSGGVDLKKVKKHTLDSDEEDSSDEENQKQKEEDNDSNDERYDGEEEGVSRFDGEVKLTPFNMKEELEEGRFDKDGHYLFNKNKDVSDNWLDNIDWIKVKSETDPAGQKKTLGEDDSDDSQDALLKPQFDDKGKYREMLSMMNPKETVKKALQRLGVRISSAERWKRKKMGLLDDSSEKVTKLTELANEILTNTGNMDVYEETYEVIEKRLKGTAGMRTAAELDMYDDNFDAEEQKKKDGDGDQDDNPEEQPPDGDILMWEFKWKQADGDEKIFGPYNTEQMQNWVGEGYFKEGVFVRKVGRETKFYSSSRIDFELYL